MSKIIAFEGIDGSGKTTFSNMLINELINNEMSVQLINKTTNRPLREIYKKLIIEDKFISNELSLLLGLADYKYTEDYVEDNTKDFIIYDRCFISSIIDLLSLGILDENKVKYFIKLFRVPNYIYFIDRDAKAVIKDKVNISKAEAGGNLYANENLKNGFMRFQNTNYMWYNYILNKYFSKHFVTIKSIDVGNGFKQIKDFFINIIV